MLSHGSRQALLWPRPGPGLVSSVALGAQFPFPSWLSYGSCPSCPRWQCVSGPSPVSGRPPVGPPARSVDAAFSFCPLRL